MKPSFLTSARILGFLLLVSSAQAAPEWKQLKEGMTSAEAVEHLGEPLLKLKARGVERWIYDGSGEVVFYGGPIRFWTVATPTAASKAKPVESDVVFRPARTLRPTTLQTPPPASYELTPVDSPRFRYR